MALHKLSKSCIGTSITTDPANSTSLLRGSNLSLNCSTDFNPVAHVYNFYFNDNLIGSSSSGVFNVTTKADGEYTCVPINTNGTGDNATVSITVVDAPSVDINPTAATVIEGNNITLSCNASGKPAPVITWKKTGESVLLSQGSSVIIVNVRRPGTPDCMIQYQCTASNGVGTNATATVNITVHYAPSVDINPTAATVIEGNNITLSCNASGKPAPVITWKKTGESVLLSQGSSVIIVNVRRPGTPDCMIQYQCTASNGVGTNATATVNITVHFEPSVTSQLCSSPVTEGDNATLHCNATGNPLPSVAWIRASTRGIVSYSKMLFMEDIKRNKSGSYECLAWNGIGKNSTKSCTIDVHYLPTALAITPAPVNTTVLRGATVALTCKTDANPAAHLYHFYFDGNHIGNSSSGVFNVTVEKDGVYTCVPINTVGTGINATVRMTVVAVPASQSATPSPSQSMSLTSRESAIVGATVSGQSDNISTSVLQSQSPSVPLVSEDVSLTTRPLQSASPSVSQKVSASMTSSSSADDASMCICPCGSTSTGLQSSLSWYASTSDVSTSASLSGSLTSSSTCYCSCSTTASGVYETSVPASQSATPSPSQSMSLTSRESAIVGATVSGQSDNISTSVLQSQSQSVPLVSEDVSLTTRPLQSASPSVSQKVSASMTSSSSADDASMCICPCGSTSTGLQSSLSWYASTSDVSTSASLSGSLTSSSTCYCSCSTTASGVYETSVPTSQSATPSPSQSLSLTSRESATIGATVSNQSHNISASVLQSQSQSVPLVSEDVSLTTRPLQSASPSVSQKVSASMTASSSIGDAASSMCTCPCGSSTMGSQSYLSSFVSSSTDASIKSNVPPASLSSSSFVSSSTDASTTSNVPPASLSSSSFVSSSTDASTTSNVPPASWSSSSFVSSSTDASITSNVPPASWSSSSFVSSSTDASTTSNVPPASWSSSSFVSSSNASITSNVPPASWSSSSFVSSGNASTTSNVPTSLSSRICYCPCSTAASTYAPSVDINPTTATVIEGNNITLTCNASGKPAPVITWKKAGESVLLSQGSSVTIVNVRRPGTPDNMIQYQCTASNGVESPATATVNVTVHYAPSVDINPTTATVIEGNNITLTCNASGKPAPVITWKKAGESVLLSQGSSVTIVNVRRPGTPDNMIQYQCTASNGVESPATATVNVTVHYAPSVDINPTTATVIEGNNITLTCNASGKPAPVITWKKAGESVLLSQGSLVTIVNVRRPGTPDNMIQYQCTASNGVGSPATATVNVTVHCKYNLQPE
ncbi:Hemicentin-1 [Desmophyllum pertusum]|uniref:Hemicentin-1 n=1 Tax=Desmophyllum pertusum TaxID=174260 RepID=A0A9X0CZ98_9CNID|nr:Hemicentin-1 [Desmophyllum pertusum]